MTSTRTFVEFLGATIMAVEFVVLNFRGTVPAERVPPRTQARSPKAEIAPLEKDFGGME
jgi:hypothetical protein